MTLRLAAAKIAKDFFPYQPKYISAVTGTNGKTSVVNFLYEIWKKIILMVLVLEH